MIVIASPNLCTQALAGLRVIISGYRREGSVVPLEGGSTDKRYPWGEGVHVGVQEGGDSGGREYVWEYRREGIVEGGSTCGREYSS